MDEKERVELEADIEKIHHTLESDRSQWQFDYDYDSDDDSDDDGEALYIDVEKAGSGSVSLASAHSAEGRATPSVQSIASQRTGESVLTDQEEDAEQLFREVGVVLDKIDSTSSLPTSLESCLIMNRAYQDIILEHISRIELALAENRETQRKLQDEAKESDRQLLTKKKYMNSTTIPYFKSTSGSCPQSNEDVRLKQMTLEPNLDERPETTWRMRQKRILLEAVKEDSLEKLLQPVFSRRELEEEKLLHTVENSAEWKEIQDKITSIDIEIDLKKNTSDELLLRDVDIARVDWMKISNLTFNGKRDWKACKRAWLHCVDPKVNHATFSVDEAERLQQLVDETGAHNWVYIAQQLGTGRTAFQCMQYYQQNLNKEKIQKPWTAEEDAQLLKVVEKCQQFHFNWHRVCQFMEGRSSMQCYKRYTKLDPRRNTGYWTEEEDALLMAAVQLFGSCQWAKIQEMVPGRTREQCRERYTNSLDPSISGLPWTYEEDRELLRGVEKYGKGQWVKIQREFCPGRTDNQVLQRFKRLQDWKRKTDWFDSQSTKTKRLLQGSNLPKSQMEEIRLRNWDQYRELFNVLPCDYEKQQRDREKGLKEVPRPPFLLGLASKKCSKIWEQRMKLQRLIEEHVEKMRDRFEIIDHNTNAGIYSLQDAISSISREVLSRHREQQLTAEVLSSRKPSAVSVGDMLAITRGNTEELNRVKIVRGPQQRRKPKRMIDRSKLNAMLKIDSELRRIVKNKLKTRALKRGRPRRFFWDIRVSQGMDPKVLNMLKATAMNLYFKSLGADGGRLLVKGRQCFPDLATKLQAQPSCSHSSSEDDSPEPEPAAERQSLRRSRRSRKVTKDEAIVGVSSADPIQTPFLPEDHILLQKRKDYEMLEWMCQLLNIPPEYPPPEDVSEEVEVLMEEEQGPERADDLGERCRPTGMLQVHEMIQQALKESLEQSACSKAPDTGAVSGSDIQEVAMETVSGGNSSQAFQSAQQLNGKRCELSASKTNTSIASEILSTVALQEEMQAENTAASPSACREGLEERVIRREATQLSGNDSYDPPSPVSVASDITGRDKADEEENAVTSASPVGKSNLAADSKNTCTALPTGQCEASSRGWKAGSGKRHTAAQHTYLGRRTYGVKVGPLAYRVFPKSSIVIKEKNNRGSRKLPPDSASTVTVDFSISDERQKFPNLPPTKSTMQAFRLLLLKRQELIKGAGDYYSSAYYQAKKDAQMTSLAMAGKPMEAINKGTMDFSRLMSRVCQETVTLGKAKRRKGAKGKFADNPELSVLQIMDSVRGSDEYKTLLSRFEAVFLWPAFLSAIYPPFQRQDFSAKAGGTDGREERDMKEARFQNMKQKLPLLKSKQYYKYANKPREKKKSIQKERQERRILRQVQELLADDDDPNPPVYLHHDSSEEEDSSAGAAPKRVVVQNTQDLPPQPQPKPSTSAAGTGVSDPADSEPAPKRRRAAQPKKNAPAAPRQSKRRVKRISYSDRLQTKRTNLPPRPPSKRELQGLPPTRHMNKKQRQRRIEMLVQMKAGEGAGDDRSQQETEGGGYVSDGDVECVAAEVGQTGDGWVRELPEDQKESLLQMEMDIPLPPFHPARPPPVNIGTASGNNN